MSHFTVLVIGDNIEAALQPFHEFECTGTSDQYVQNIDRTEEARQEFAEDTTNCLRRLDDGTLHTFFDEKGEWRLEFSQPAPERFDSTRRTKYVPVGYEQIDVPTSQVETLAQWAQGYYGWKVVPHGQQPDLTDEHKFGYILVDEAGEVVRCVDRTNPNKKWDWWTLGGRWTGKLLLKDGRTGMQGEPGMMTEANADPRRCDAALAGDVDWDGLLAEHQEKAAAMYDSIMAGIAGREIQSWAQVIKRRDAGEFDIDGARTFYNAQPVVVDLKQRKILDDWDGAEDLSRVLAAKDRQSYIDRLAKERVSTWALLHDGRWTERGEMGWFGLSDATNGSTLDYVENFWLTVRALPADTQLSVVDCHI